MCLRENQNLGCSEEFARRNFAQSTYTNKRGREYSNQVFGPNTSLTKAGESTSIVTAHFWAINLKGADKANAHL